MKTVRSIEKQEILRRAQHAAEDYNLATDIPVRLLWLDKATVRPCCLCPLHNSADEAERCRSTHLAGAVQAELTGDAYFYFCSCSLLFWSNPVFLDGTMIGALIAGPTMMIDAQELVQEWQMRSPDAQIHQLVRASSRISRVSPKKAKSLAEMLRLSSTWIYESSAHLLSETKHCQDQQSAISSYIHHLKETDECELHEITFLVQLETDLYASIQSGNKHHAQKVLNEILGDLYFTTGNNFETIKIRITELIVILSRAAIAGGADPRKVFSLNQVYLRQAGSFRTLDALSYWLSEVLNTYIQLVFFLDNLKHEKRLEKAVHYIQTHYTEKLTLEQLASYTALSPSYFSSVFKEGIGMSLTSYINQVRIGHAKSLLKNTSLKLIDISSMVGFDEQSYFSRVFKNETGISPNKYRSNIKIWATSPQEAHAHEFA